MLPEGSKFRAGAEMFGIGRSSTTNAIIASSSTTDENNLSEPTIKKSNKKKLVWADACSRQLEEVFYFVLEENERGMMQHFVD